MTWLASLLNGLFDLLLRPFGGAPWAGLAVVSALAGVAMLWLFKLTTNQDLLARRRRELTGGLYELSLYQDSLAVMARLQARLLAANLRYLLVSLPALLVLLPLALLTVVQLDARFQRRALRAGEEILVTARYAEGASPDRLALAPAAGLAVAAGPVRDRAERTVWWRVRAERDAPAEFAVVDGAGRYEKRLVPDGALGRLSASRVAAGWRHVLLHPAESPLPGGAVVTELKAELPARGADRFGMPGWLWGFCLFSIAGGLAVKGLFKVEI
ncbi:MAG: hypothetical protein IPM94_06045 [bacterium]|nr:hypothetical protein [bacterium]